MFTVAGGVESICWLVEGLVLVGWLMKLRFLDRQGEQPSTHHEVGSETLAAGWASCSLTDEVLLFDHLPRSEINTGSLLGDGRCFD